MRVHPIHLAVLAAGALLAGPALAKDYPLPAMGAVAYSEAGYETEWNGEGEVIYMDELEEGEEWRSSDYDYPDGYEQRQVRTVVRHDPRPLPPPRTGEPAWGGERPLSYGEGERQAWLAECRSRMSRGHDFGVDACADYLARYESGAGGYSHGYSYGYGEVASHGCGSCGCGCGNGGCGGGGCGCTVSYRFAPMPVAQTVQPRPAKARRIVTTEEWVEEAPAKAVRVIPPPPPPAPTKLVPVAPEPVKPVKTRSIK